MASLLRLAYVSKATIDLSHGIDDPDSEASQILLEARRNNRASKITGALFISGNFFFQCLEGKEDAVYALFESIKQDSRHEQVKMSYCKRVRRRHFGKWTMKYVPAADEVKQMMERRGYLSFNPVEFDESDINVIVDTFSRTEDTTAKISMFRTFNRPKNYWFTRMFDYGL